MRLTAVYMKVPEGYIAFVEELPGANTQGETLEEARANLEEAVSMVLDANREMSEQSLAGADVIRESLILPAVKRTDRIRHLEQHGCKRHRQGRQPYHLYVKQKGSAIIFNSAASRSE